MKKINTLFVLLLVCFLAGCAGFSSITEQRQRGSSGRIGCAPDSITIVSTGDATWTASCKGKLFYCTARPSASCTESIQ